MAGVPTKVLMGPLCGNLVDAMAHQTLQREGAGITASLEEGFAQ
jgi:hypothetical protein